MKRQILAVSILLVATQLFGQESRFWVGGSGKWADNSHWATVSGGEPGATVPESGTSVVFDANSFSGAKNTVTLSDEVVIGSLTASDAEFVFSGKKDLTVGGSVNVDSNVDFGKLRGALVLSAEGNQTLNLPATLEGDIVINGGSWTLVSDLATEGNITLNAGSLNTAGHSVTCSVFTATENAEELDIRNSSMVTDKWFTNAAENMTVKAAGSIVYVYKHINTNFKNAYGQLYNRIQIKSAKKDAPTVNVTLKKAIQCPDNATNSGTEPYVATYEVELSGGSGTYSVGALKENSSDASKYNKEGKKHPSVKLGKGTYRIGYYSGPRQEDYELLGVQIVNVEAPLDFTGGVEVDSGATCYGDDIVLKSTVKNGTEPYKYIAWEENVNVSPNTKVTAHNGDNIYLTVTDKNGCTFDADPFRYLLDDEENNSYTDGPAKIEIDKFTPEPACEDESTGKIKILAKGGYKEHTFYKYELSGPQDANATGTTIAQAELSDLKKGSYTLKISDDKCESEDLSVSLDDVKKPIIKLGGDEYLCEDDKNPAIKKVKIEGDYTSVKWISDNVAVSLPSGQDTVLNPNLTINTTGLSSLTLVAKNGSCTTDPATKNVTVISLPDPTIITTDGNVCGLEVEIKATPGIAGNEANLVADVEEALDGGAKDPSSKGLNLKVTKAGRYKIVVKEKKTEGGCDCYGKSSIITLTFFDKPVFEKPKFNAPSSVCGEGVLSNITVNTKNATTFKWTLEKGADSSFGPDDEATTKYTTQVADVTTNKRVRLKVVAGNDGCKDEKAISDTISFAVYAKPNPTINKTKYTTCNDTIELEGKITAGNTDVTWTPSDKTKVKIVDSKIDKDDKTKITAKAVLIAGAEHKTYTVTLDEKGQGDCGTIKSTAADLVFKDQLFVTLEKDSVNVCDGATECSAVVLDKRGSINWEVTGGVEAKSLSQEKATYKLEFEGLKEIKRIRITANATEAGCKTVSASTLIKILPVPVVTINKDTAVCGLVYNVPEFVSSVDLGDDESVKSLYTHSWTPSLSEHNAEYKNGVFRPLNMGDKDSVICKLNLTEVVGECSDSKDADIKFYALPEVKKLQSCKDTVCDEDDLSIDLTQVFSSKHFKSLKWSSSGVGFIPDDSKLYEVTDDDRNQGYVELTLRAEGFGGCDADELTVKIHIKSPVTPTITDGEFDVCKNDVVEYKTQPGMSEYVWKVDGVTVGTDSVLNYKWTNDPDKYPISVSYSNGCAIKTSLPDSVVVHGMPTIPPVFDTTCTKTPWDFDATITGNYTYSWKTYLDKLQTPASQPDIIFLSEESGDYQLVCLITDIDYGCPAYDTVNVHVVQAPEIKVNTITPVCDDADFVNNYKPGEYCVEVENNDDCTYLWEVVSGTGSFNGTEEDLAMVYEPTADDREAGEVKFKFSVTKKHCTTVSDTITVKLLQPLNAGIGSVAPFRIASSTEINVTIIGSYSGGYADGLGFYLVAPDGTELKLYQHDRKNSKNWTINPKDFDITFSTESNDVLNLINFGKGTNAEGTFGIADWSAINGMNPAEGGWAVRVGGSFTKNGKLMRAIITFSDHMKNDPSKPIKKVKFDSKEITPALSIRNGSSAKYISPIGLHVECYGDSIEVVSKPLRDGDLAPHSYTFEWATSSDFTPASIIAKTSDKSVDTLKLAAGKYYISIIDENGCSVMDSFEITQPEKITIGQVRNDTIACYGDSTGVLEVKVTNLGAIQSNFDFSWTKKESKEELAKIAKLEKLAAGDYVVTVTNTEDGCQQDSTLTVVQPAAPLTASVIEDSTLLASCGGSTGRVMFKAEGGTKNYKLYAYLNDNYVEKDKEKEDILTAASLPGKKIPFKIQDANKCEYFDTVSTEPDTLSLKVLTIKEVKCFGDSATVQVEVTNAKPGVAYVYKWDGGEKTGSDVAKLLAGSHKVEVAEAGATECFTEKTFTIKGAREVTKTFAYLDSIKCYGETSARFYVKADSTGTPKGIFSYTWTDEEGATISTDSLVENVGVGKYYVTIKSVDKCEYRDSFEVKGPEKPLKIDHNKVVLSKVPDCGKKNGTITADAFGGAGGYTYKWIQGNDTLTSQTAAVGSGQYKLVVTDKLGCSVDSLVNVTDNGVVKFKYDVVNSITCKDREDAEIKISEVRENGASISSFKVKWFNANGDSLTAETTKDTLVIANVGNNAVLRITTSNGCSKDSSVVATGERTLRFGKITNKSDWNGTPEGADGKLEVQVAGGSKDYDYTWSIKVPGNDIDEDDKEKTDTTSTLYERMAGQYNLLVTDNSGCQIDTTLEVKFEPIDAIVTVDSVKCKGAASGAVKLSGFGGNPGADYKFLWTKVDDEEYLPQQKNGFDVTFSNLAAGWYNCKIWQVDIETDKIRDTLIWVGEPTTALRIPDSTYVITDTYCYDKTGEIFIKEPADSAAAFDIFNGYWPLTFAVKKDGVAIPKTNLETGWYTIYVEDSLHCKDSISVEVGDKTKFTVAANPSENSYICFGGKSGIAEVSASIENGGNFTYAWTKWQDSKGVELPEPRTVFSEDSIVRGLAAGAYIANVTVTIDNKTCEKSDTVYMEQSDSISFKLTVGSTSCFTRADAEVRLDSLRGGENKFNLFKFLGEKNTIFIDRDSLVNEYKDNQTVLKDSSYVLNGHLLPGNYSVFVKDAASCFSDTIAFTVTSLPRVSFAISNIEPNSCYNSNDGEVKLENLQGGVEKYNFFEVYDTNKNVLFSDSMLVISKADTIGTDTTAIFAPGLTVGKYLVRVADTSDCYSEFDTLQVFTKRPRIVLDTIIDNVLPECGMFKKDGSISNEGEITVYTSKLMTPDVKTMGADLKLFFKVDDGEFKADSVITGLVAGEHSITISYADTSLCVDTVYTHTLGAKSNLVADAHFIGTQKAIFTCPDKELTAYVESGENGGPFSYTFYTLSDEDAEKLAPVKPAPEPAKEEKPVENNPAVNDSTTNIPDTASAVAYNFHRGLYYRADSAPAVADSADTPAVADSGKVILPVYNHQTIRGRQVSVLDSGSVADDKVKVLGKTWRAYADDIKPYGYETFYYFEITNDQCISVDSIKATALRPVEDLQIIVDMEDVTSDELLIDGEYQVPEGGLLTLTANQLEFEFSDNIFAFAENGWLWQSAPADENESSSSGLFIGRIEATSSTMNENPLYAQGYGKFIAKVWDSVRFELSDYSEGVYRINDTALTCSYYDTVVVNAESSIKPRKVFTPNGDGHNDTWKISGMASYDNATIYVFNRWGGRVWQYSGTGREYDTKEWDGRNEKNKPVPSGTYYYVIQCSDGVLGGKKVTGPVTIIR